MSERTKGQRPGDEFQDGHRLRQYHESGSSGFITGQKVFCDACATSMGKDPQHAGRHWVRSDDNCEHPDHDFNVATAGVEEPTEYEHHKDNPDVVGWTKDNFGPGSDTTLCPSCAEDRRSRGHSMEPYYPLTSGRLMPEDSCDDCGHDLHQGRKTAMRKQSAYYGEAGQYPTPGTVVRRDHADPGHSWGRGGQVYDFHADGDSACEHQKDTEWRPASDHCTGHYNPKHPLQAAIDKYNNYKGSRNFVPIMNNTWIHKDDQDNFHIRHHNTDILSVAPNGDTTIDVDGWHTPTTGKRLHQFLPKNIAKMRNPSRAQGASEHTVAVNSDPDHYVYGHGEERGRFGMHPNTTLHDYEDGISFNAKTGERVQNNAASHSGTTVRPPMARGAEDASEPGSRERLPSRYRADSPASWYSTPAHEPHYHDTGVDPSVRGADSQSYDQYRYNPNNTSGASSMYDPVHHPIANDDLPREDESYDDWINRTTKAPEKVACPSCKGRGSVRDTSPVPPGVQPWEHKKPCPNCQGEGLIHNKHARLVRNAGLVSHETLMRRYEEGLRIMATLTIEAYGETKAPIQVDTLRDDACPVCGESDAFDGDQCQVCGFVTPPKMFQDPDLDKAKLLDLRGDPASGAPNDVDPNVGQNLPPVDPEAVDEEGEVPGEEEQPGAEAAEIQEGDDANGVVEGDVRTLDDGPVSPDEVDEEGEAPDVDTSAPGQKILQGGEPFTKGPNAPTPEEPMDPATMEEEQEEADEEEGIPDAVDGQEEVPDEGEAEGAPGYAGDETPDLLCPACGFEAPASQPMSTGMNSNAPADAGDGMLEGDVCPKCQKATMMGVGQLNEMDAQAAAV